MYAVLETGGKQIKATTGRFIDIEKLPVDKGEKVSFDNILLLSTEKELKIGSPYVKGALVKGQVIEQGKEDKVIVYKMRPKKRTRRKRGHRQLFSRVFIESIELDGKVLVKAEEKKQKEVKSEIEKEKPSKKTNQVKRQQRN